MRAVRQGHVYLDLPTVATTVAPDDETVELDPATPGSRDKTPRDTAPRDTPPRDEPLGRTL